MSPSIHHIFRRICGLRVTRRASWRVWSLQPLTYRPQVLQTHTTSLRYKERKFARKLVCCSTDRTKYVAPKSWYTPICTECAQKRSVLPSKIRVLHPNFWVDHPNFFSDDFFVPRLVGCTLICGGTLMEVWCTFLPVCRPNDTYYFSLRLPDNGRDINFYEQNWQGHGNLSNFETRDACKTLRDFFYFRRHFLGCIKVLWHFFLSFIVLKMFAIYTIDNFYLIKFYKVWLTWVNNLTKHFECLLYKTSSTLGLRRIHVSFIKCRWISPLAALLLGVNFIEHADLNFLVRSPLLHTQNCYYLYWRGNHTGLDHNLQIFQL